MPKIMWESLENVFLKLKLHALSHLPFIDIAIDILLTRSTLHYIEIVERLKKIAQLKFWSYITHKWSEG